METCKVCIRKCPLGESFCHRRDDSGNLLFSDRYSAISFDNLYDKPVMHLGGNRKILSIGSWGCNLRCQGCQNADLSWVTNGSDLKYIEMTPDDIVSLAVKNLCEGICFTFNEPAILLESVLEAGSRAKENGLFNVFVTNSTLTADSVRKLSAVTDAVAADIKSLDDDFYYNYCGAKGIPDITTGILGCIKGFGDAGCHVEIRTNIIPGGNDTEENYHGIARWILKNMGAETPWHITRFFPAHRLSHLYATPVDEMEKAVNAGIDEGLMHVYIHTGKGCDCADKNDMIAYKSLSGKPHCCCNN